MTKTSEKKYCGNCDHHSVYHYPGKLFCMFRFNKKENPIVETLSVCENWRQDYQTCFCVKEALKFARSQESQK